MGISEPSLDAVQLDDDVTGALKAAGCGDAKVQVGGMFDSHGCSSWCKEARSKIDCNSCDCVSVMSAAARLTTCHMRASCARAREQIANSTPTTHMPTSCICDARVMPACRRVPTLDPAFLLLTAAGVLALTLHARGSPLSRRRSAPFAERTCSHRRHARRLPTHRHHRIRRRRRCHRRRRRLVQRIPQCQHVVTRGARRCTRHATAVATPATVTHATFVSCNW